MSHRRDIRSGDAAATEPQAGLLTLDFGRRRFRRQWREPHVDLVRNRS
jgi:hypothetical protein